MRRCVVCGSPMRIPPCVVPDGSGATAVECVACLERQVRDGGGLAFSLPERPDGLSRLVLTRPTAGALAEAGQSAISLVEQHLASCGSGKAASLHALGRGGGLVCVVRHVVAGGLAVALLLTAGGSAPGGSQNGGS